MIYDKLVRGGMVIDGTGSPWFRADIGIQNGRIAHIGRLSAARATEVLDADGLYVAPGFVDIHSHGDHSVVANPEARVKIMQGVTTQLDGNCGMSIAPLGGEAVDWAVQQTERYSVDVTWRSFGEYFSRLEQEKPAVNVACLVGHGTVRLCVMGYDSRKPSEAQIEAMASHVQESMESGCRGLSTGLVYPPGLHASPEEIVELCRVASRFGGVYASHVRGDRETQIESTQEFIRTAQEAEIPGILSHIEAKYPYNDPSYQHWKLAMMEEARSRGIDVTADTHSVRWIGIPDIRGLLPFPWRTRDPQTLLGDLEDPQTRARVKKDMCLDPRDPRARGGPFGLTQRRAWHRVVVYRCPSNPISEGKRIDEIASERDRTPEDTIIDLYVEERGNGPFLLLAYIESDMPTVTRHHLVVPAMTDLFASNPENCPGDTFDLFPEWLGVFPDYIRTCVLDSRYVPLEEGIRKITSLPMRMMGIWDRGIIRPGFWADLVVFDTERLRCGSSLSRPKGPPEGIEYVLVNGEIVVCRGDCTNTRPGCVLRLR